MFLDGHRIVGATLNGSIIGDDHTFLPFHQPDACDDTGRGRLVVVHIPGRQRAEFQEGCIWITEQLDALTCQQFIAFAMPGNGPFASALLYHLNTLAELIYQLLKVVSILLKFGTIAVYTCFDNAHCFNSSRLIVLISPSFRVPRDPTAPALPPLRSYSEKTLAAPAQVRKLFARHHRAGENPPFPGCRTP